MADSGFQWRWCSNFASRCAFVKKGQYATTRFLDAQVADHEEKVDADGTSASALVVDVHAQDRDMAEAALHWSLRPCPCNQTFKCPFRVTFLQEHTN